MAIFFDTNILPKRGHLLHDVVISAILQIAKIKGIQVQISSIVVDESVNMRLDDASQAFEKLNSAYTAASRYFDFESIYIPTAREIAQLWRKDLEENFVVVAINGNDAAEALRREALRIPPASKGRGSRDSAVWLTALRSHRSTGGPTYFVSRNTHDFGEGSPVTLHSHLTEELSDSRENFHYFTDTDSLLAHFGQRVDITVSADQIDDFTGEVLDSFIDQVDLAEIGEIDTRTVTAIVLHSPEIAPVRHAYRLDSTILARLKISAWITVHSSQQTEQTTDLPIRAGAWAQLGDSGSVIALNVDDVGLRLDG